MSDLGNKEVMAQNIQHYMNEWGISRKELANKLGLSYTTLSSWLQADSYPRIDKIEKMANFFQISKADLVERHQNDDRPAELTKNQRLVAYSIDPDISDEERQDIINLVKIAMKNRRRI